MWAGTSAKKRALNPTSSEQSGLVDLTNQYENLRQSVINKPQRRDSGLGLALFLRAGMTVWMQTCGQLSQPSHTTSPISNTREQKLDVRQRGDLINILVTMVLNQRKEQER
jgi:hypothetical protein